MSVSSVGSRESECLLGKHQARLGQEASVNDRFIRVRGQVRSSGGDTTARVRQGYDPPPLSSPRSRMLVVSPPLLDTGSGSCWDWPRPPTHLIGLYGLFAAFRNISGETGTAVTIQLWSLSPAAQLNTINPARSRAWYSQLGQVLSVSREFQHNASKVGTTVRSSHIISA